MWYNIIRKREEKNKKRIPQKKGKIKMKSYWKSTMSGDIYEMSADWTPKYGGWERSTAEEYKAFIKKMGYKA